jgi:hypothetical protein
MVSEARAVVKPTGGGIKIYLFPIPAKGEARRMPKIIPWFFR